MGPRRTCGAAASSCTSSCVEYPPSGQVHKPTPPPSHTRKAAKVVQSLLRARLALSHVA